MGVLRTRHGPGRKAENRRPTQPCRPSRFCLLCSVFFALSAFSQEPAPATRAEEIHREQVEKSRRLTPAAPGPIELWLDRTFDDDKWPGRLFFSLNGFGLRFGGMRPGSGLGFGPRFYRRDLANERVMLETSVVASYLRYWSAEARLKFPSLRGSRWDAEIAARHSDAPTLRYYGPGAGSNRGDKTNYRREDTAFTGALAWRPHRVLRAGWSGGANLVNIGRGRITDSPSIETRFNPAAIPGLGRQSHYLLAGPFASFDTRDWPDDPHRGTLLDASYMSYWDYDHGLYSFRRLAVQAEHYVPVLNQTRVFAFRARTQMSFTSGRQAVPFFLQPTLGGPDDVRGFDRYRFHDNNALVLNAEYRWEVSPVLDVALFADAGNVFRRPGLIGFRNMEEAGGIGFRIKTRNLVIMRLDTAASREGIRIWLRFSNAFPVSPLFR